MHFVFDNVSVILGWIFPNRLSSPAVWHAHQAMAIEYLLVYVFAFFLQVAEDFPNHHPVFDTGNHIDGATALSAGLYIDINSRFKR